MTADLARQRWMEGRKAVYAAQDKREADKAAKKKGKRKTIQLNGKESRRE